MAMDSLFRKSTYHRRLFLWLVGYSVVMVGCFVAFQYHRERDFKSTEIDAQLQLINRFILSRLEEGDDISEIAETKFHPFDTIRISLLDPEGYIVFDNTLDSLPAINHLNREEIREARAKGTGYAVHRMSESTGNTYFYSAARDTNGFIVRTALPYSVTLDTLLRADYGFLWAMCLITLAMCLLGYFATRRLGQHIKRLNQFAQNAEKGMKFSDEEPFPHDELGEISNHIVRLYARLQQAIVDRDREHRAALHEHQEKERIKKQLTNNINHELKTPLAGIQVCLETLMAHPDMAPEKRQEFLGRGLRQSERLGHLLADVALITRMEDGQDAIEKHPVRLDSIIAETIAEKLPAAEAAGIVVNDDLTDAVTVNGNANILASIFSNLIDNAIAYSGGTEISITHKSEGNGIVLIFADNGTGIAPEHLPRIFERFYRIDKGRSRALGGTGLGLSIVKNGVHFHGGTITVGNQPKGGLFFRITLPVLTET